jgi:hypothetical protein
MSKVRGVLLIMAGAGVAAYMLSTGAVEFGRKAPPRINIATSLPAPIQVVVVSEPDPSGAQTRETGPAVAPRPAGAGWTQDLRAQPFPSAVAAPREPAQWPPYVTDARAERTPSRLPLPLSREPDGFPNNSASLTRDLQRELRRVGCYDGTINGGWTKSTRRAMKTFTERVNASLPLEEPDQVLLALVKNYPDGTCDRPCPQGQGMGETGRCLPNALLVRAEAGGSMRTSAGSAARGSGSELKAPVVIGRSTSITAPPPEGRMALAGPQLDEQALSPAVPMPSSGVSLLPGGADAAAAPPRPAQERAEKSRGKAWARTFLKRREGLF